MFFKKACALLLAFALLVPSRAPAEDIPAYQPGDTVDLVFTVTENPNKAIGATLKLSYDHSAFELIPSTLVQNDAPIINIYFDGIPVGEKVACSFLVLPGAGAGDYELSITVEQAANIAEEEVDGLIFSSCLVEVINTQDALAQANAENEALRQQLADLQKALETQQARAEAAEREGGEEEAPYTAPESDFTYKIVDGFATITKYIGEGGDVVIPDTLGGYPVKVIGENAFHSCTRLTHVTLPDTVTSVSTFCFANCGGLRSIAFPSGTESIGSYAFTGCGNLSSVSLPASVTFVGYYAFSRCSPDLVFQVEGGSYAQTFCEQNSLSFEIQ